MNKDDYVAPPTSKSGGDYVMPPTQNKGNDYVAPPTSKNDSEYVNPRSSQRDGGYVAPPTSKNDNDYVSPSATNKTDIYVNTKKENEFKDNVSDTVTKKDFSEIKNKKGSYNQSKIKDYLNNRDESPTFVYKFKNIFRSIDRSWLKRHYIFSFFVFLLIYSMLPKTAPIGWGFCLLSAFMYPYAMFIYESLRNFILGDTSIFLTLKNLFIWKLLKILIVWFLAIPIGVLGLIYLYFKVNKK